MSTLRPFFKHTLDLIKAKKYDKALDFVAQHRDPVLAWATQPSSVVKTLATQGKYNSQLEGLKRSIRTSLGGTAHRIKSIKEEGLRKTLVNQVKSDLYREVELTNKNKLLRIGKKDYLKSRSVFSKDREVLGRTNRDSVIVRKRPILTPLSLALDRKSVV